MKIPSNLRIKRVEARIDESLLKNVKDLTLDTLRGISKDPEDPRQNKAKREVERRQRINESRERFRSKNKSNRDKQNGKKASKNSEKKLDLMKSPIPQ